SLIQMSEQLMPELSEDVIRRIINYSDHSLGELRKVSKAWKTLVEEELSNLSRLPPFEEIEIVPAEGDPSSIVIELKIKKEYGFVLQSFSKFGFWEVPSVDREMYTAQKDIPLVALLGERTVLLATPKVIKRVVIREMQGRLKLLADYFRNIQFEELVFDAVDLTPRYSEEILVLIRDWNATSVEFSFLSHSLHHPDAFLVQVSELVDALTITQSYSNSYVFGGRDWLVTLAEMLRKRVSFIRIRHDDKTVIATQWELLHFVQRLNLNVTNKRVRIELNAFFERNSFGFSFSHAEDEMNLNVKYNKKNIRECVISIAHNVTS
ncbi:hypothetical protein PMAYCL1PPCAC_25387, partial [Pristionchus mayeri]